MKSHLFFFLVVAVAILCGCKSAHQCPAVLPPAPPVLPADRREAVWLHDEIVPYTSGRYSDRRDPNVLHEAHRIYRREQTSRPNLSPPEALLFPPVASPSATNAIALLRDGLTAELNQQRSTSLEIIKQAKEIDQRLRQINARTEELREALQESARLRAQLQTVTARLEMIENTVQAAPNGATNPPAKQGVNATQP